jgi:ribose-phosphate pyrophosphokinase
MIRGYKVFTGTAHKKFAEDICRSLNIYLSSATVGKFSDGEINV